MKKTEQQLAQLEKLMRRILTATPRSEDGVIEITPELQQLVSAGFEALQNPRPRLVMLGLVNQKKWRNMKRGGSRFTMLYPLDHPRNSDSFCPVYGIGDDE